MNEELKNYLYIEAKVSAAFSFFINGMFAALIYHKADLVPVTMTALAVDILITCLLTGTITAYFSTFSLRRTKSAGILQARGKVIPFLSRLFLCPSLFGLLIGGFVAAPFFILILIPLTLLGIETLPFACYFAGKTLFSALLGGSATFIELNAGMYYTKNESG